MLVLEMRGLPGACVPSCFSTDRTTAPPFLLQPEPLGCPAGVEEGADLLHPCAGFLKLSDQKRPERSVIPPVVGSLAGVSPQP